MEAKSPAETGVSNAHGHLTVRIEGAHPPEVMFAFAAQRSRMAGSLATTVLIYAVAVVVIVLLGRLPHVVASAPVQQEEKLSDQIVWLTSRGPVAAAAVAATHMPDPPKPVELKGKQKITRAGDTAGAD